MGLFKFLKEKFSKKRREKEQNSAELNDFEEKVESVESEEKPKTDVLITNENIEKIENEIAKQIAPTKQETTNDATKYDKGMEKSRESFSKRISALNKKFKSKKIDDEYFSTLEEILIEADCGVEFTLNIIEDLVDTVKKEKMTKTRDINELLITKMFNNYYKDADSEFKDIDFSTTPKVLLVVGVNGVGKTTSIAKLAYRYINQGKKVMLVAADTFRAGAKEQLTIWAKRLNISIVTGNDGEDPASVAYKGVKYGKENKYDLIIIDTAGRLQNKQNLMDELGKINRVIHKEIEHKIDCYLIIDATTGQNGVSQATAFKNLIDIDGIVITKMDGTSKGGIILAIKQELDIPVKFVGLGEKFEDLEEFDLNKYLYGLCKELIEDEE